MARKGMKSQQDLGVQYNRLSTQLKDNPRRQEWVNSAFIKMNSRMGMLTDGILGGSAKKFSAAERMGIKPQRKARGAVSG